MDRYDIEYEARRLLPCAEGGDRCSLSTGLNSMTSVSNRVAVALAMVQINSRRRQLVDPNIPVLSVEVRLGRQRQEHLEGMTIKTSRTILGTDLSLVKDVYDPPGRWIRPFNLTSFVWQAIDLWDQARLTQRKAHAPVRNRSLR